MCEFERRKERFSIQRAIQERLFEGNVHWVSMPWTASVRGLEGHGPGPFLEGGGVLLVGRDIKDQGAGPIGDGNEQSDEQ